MITGIKNLSHEIMLNNNEITSSNEENVIDLLLDSKLDFEIQIGSLYRKAGQKINKCPSKVKELLKSRSKKLTTYYSILSLSLSLLTALKCGCLRHAI